MGNNVLGYNPYLQDDRISLDWPNSDVLNAILENMGQDFVPHNLNKAALQRDIKRAVAWLRVFSVNGSRGLATAERKKLKDIEKKAGELLKLLTADSAARICRTLSHRFPSDEGDDHWRPFAFMDDPLYRAWDEEWRTQAGEAEIAETDARIHARVAAAMEQSADTDIVPSFEGLLAGLKHFRQETGRLLEERTTGDGKPTPALRIDINEFEVFVGFCLRRVYHRHIRRRIGVTRYMKDGEIISTGPYIRFVKAVLDAAGFKHSGGLSNYDENTIADTLKRYRRGGRRRQARRPAGQDGT